MGGNVRINKKMDFEYFKKMKQAGCEWIGIGIESGSKKVLTLMKKGFSPKDAHQNLKNARKNNIKCVINIIVGFPGETRLDFFKTLLFLIVKKKKIDTLGNLEMLDIYPETDIYVNYSKYNVQLYNENSNYWITKDNKNNYHERCLRKHITVKLVKLLKFKNASQTNFNIKDKYFSIAESYFIYNDLKKSLKFIKLHIKKNPSDKNAYKFMNEIKNKLN